jgi:heat shock protein HslJ
MVRRSFFLFALFSLACSSRGPAPRPATNLLAGTEWVLTAFYGTPPVKDSRITLNFERDSAGGYNGCNWYGGPYAVNAGNLRFGEVSATARACFMPVGVGQQEQRYHRALERITAYRTEGGRLDLTDSRGETVLSYGRRQEHAVNPADLIGKTWRLQSVNGRRTQPGVTIQFSGNQVSGFAGCRDYTGTYSTNGDRLRVSSISMSATECNRSNVVNEQEGQFTTDLSETRHYRIVNGNLELLTDPGRVLIFSP